jgi:hypothetical protein
LNPIRRQGNGSLLHSLKTSSSSSSEPSSLLSVKQTRGGAGTTGSSVGTSTQAFASSSAAMEPAAKTAEEVRPVRPSNDGMIMHGSFGMSLPRSQSTDCMLLFFSRAYRTITGK